MARREQDAQFNLRLPRELLKRLQTSASAQGRSVNADLLIRLAFTLRPEIESQLEARSLAARMEKMADAYEQLAKQAGNKERKEALLNKAAAARQWATELDQEPEL